MADPGTGGTSSLVEVARVLVQQGRQYGTSYHDVRKTIGGDCTEAFSICCPALPIVRSISCLLGTGYNEHSRSSKWIGRNFQGQLEFHLRRERCRITLIGDVKIRNDSEHALLFFGLELLGSNLDRIIMNINSGALSCNSQLDASHNFELTWTQFDRGRYPVCKILGADAELIGNAGCHAVKLEHPVLFCHDRKRVIAISFLENNRRVRDRIAVEIGDGAHNDCCSWCLLTDLAQRRKGKD